MGIFLPCGYIAITRAAQTRSFELAPALKHLQSNVLHAEYAYHAYWEPPSHTGKAPRGAASPAQRIGSRRPPRAVAARRKPCVGQIATRTGLPTVCEDRLWP